jgi:hypothetical protein
VSIAAIVESLLRLIAGVAPGIIAAATDHSTDEEAIESMVERVEDLPVRGGDDGAWAEDLRRRKAEE